MIATRKSCAQSKFDQYHSSRTRNEIIEGDYQCKLYIPFLARKARSCKSVVDIRVRVNFSDKTAASTVLQALNNERGFGLINVGLRSLTNFFYDCKEIPLREAHIELRDEVQLLVQSNLSCGEIAVAARPHVRDSSHTLEVCRPTYCAHVDFVDEDFVRISKSCLHIEEKFQENDHPTAFDSHDNFLSHVSGVLGRASTSFEDIAKNIELSKCITMWIP